MSYRWEPASGTFDEHELDEVGFRKDFDSQEAAEEWLSLFFDDLVDIGVTDVTLMEGTRVVYGPMSLLP